MKKLLSDARKLILIMIVPYVMIIVIGLMPINYNLISPGGLNRVSDVIEIAEDKGINQNINTVYVYAPSRITILEYLIGKIDPTFSVYETSPYYIATAADELQAGQIQKESSINNSLIVAYEAADKVIDYEYAGDIIDMVYRYTDSDIRIGDIVTAVNGHKLEKAHDLEELTKESYLTVPTFEAEVLRKGEKTRVTVTKPATKSGAGIPGFSYYEKYTIISSEPSFTIRPSNTGGPSGGLMQTLSIYATLTGEDLAHGKMIAGTGTIETVRLETGDNVWVVGPIGGAYQKVIAANRAGADVFFVPKDNFEEAKASYDRLGKTKMQLVMVEDFEDALHYLEGIR